MRTSRLYHQLHNLLSQPMTWADRRHLPELRQVKYLNNRVELSAPLHQTTDKTQNGIWFIQHGTANPILLGYNA